MLPLSFREFLDFHGFYLRETGSALGGMRRQAFDQNGERYDMREVFEAYMRFGGMPGIADLGLDQEKALALLDGIYSTVVMRDILERERRRGQRQITDSALLRKNLLGFRNRDSGHAIENVVYFELLRRGYDVAIGKIDNQEVDFIATTADDKQYIQVTESMRSEDVRQRELSPLRKIRDNYEKSVLSLEPGLDSSYDGIRSLNLIDWLLAN